MKRVVPDKIYRGLPCSTVSVGCALGVANRAAIRGLKSPYLTEDGFLSLTDMNHLVRAHLRVKRRKTFREEDRPVLRDFAHSNLGKRAVVCVLGHYLYFDGKDYHSFFWNGGDEVVSVWYLN